MELTMNDVLHVCPSNLLRLTVECVDGDNYKMYINGKFLTTITTGGFVPDQYKLEMKDTPSGSSSFQAEWFTLELRYADLFKT